MIPYNPSSFNSNKTILEQILELKNWLINHPQYEVYYCNDTALLSPVINSFSLADVPDNTNMDVGDLVVCNNAVYCTVMSVDRDNGVFTAGYGISFKGDTGATGNDGKSIRVSSENYVNDSTAYSRANIQPVHSINQHDIVLFANDYIGYVSTISGVNFYVTATQNIKGDVGANGVSITNVTINASNHLIVTLSDGSTIDAGLINFSEEYVEVSTSSGTLSNDDRLKIIRGATLIYVDGNNKYYLEPYKYNNISQSIYYSNARIESNVNEGGKVRATIHTITGNYAITIVSTNGKVVLAENIDSESQSNGKVLMANGSGGASWQTPSGSSHIVEINSTSGTFTLDEYNTLLNDDGIIVYKNGTTKQDFYTKYNEDNTYIYYSKVDLVTYNTRLEKIKITKSTYAYIQETQSIKLAGSNITSSGATSGQVLQADGSGGASWQNAGGSTKYQHNISITRSEYNIWFNFITDSSTPISTSSALKTVLNDLGFNNYVNNLLANGYYNLSTNYCIVHSIYNENNNLLIYYTDVTNNSFSSISISNPSTITDKVITL